MPKREYLGSVAVDHGPALAEMDRITQPTNPLSIMQFAVSQPCCGCQNSEHRQNEQIESRRPVGKLAASSGMSVVSRYSPGWLFGVFRFRQDVLSKSSPCSNNAASARPLTGPDVQAIGLSLISRAGNSSWDKSSREQVGLLRTHRRSCSPPYPRVLLQLQTRSHAHETKQW